MRTAPLVLASVSPRRRELLSAIGVPHEVVPASGEEPPTGALGPAEHVLASARFKAADVATRLPGRLVLGADTIVTLGDAPEDVLGKPRDPADAVRMLRLLSGRSHRVLTGIALHGGRLGDVTDVATTEIRLAVLDERLIARHVASGEPLDKAGACAVQGRLAAHVESLHGSWTNVVGLPLERLPALFRSAGEDLADWQDW